MAKLSNVEAEPTGTLSEDEKQKADAAVEALTALAQATLSSSRRTRFSEAARLCEIGQSLVRATSRRVADMDSRNRKYHYGEDDMAEENVGRIHFTNNGMLVDEYRRPLDENQIIRDTLLSLSKASTEQQKLAAIAESEAAELRALVEVGLNATSPEKEVIEARVARLMKNMEDRNAVVPADGSRGHSTRGHGGGADASSGDGADAPGSAGDGDASCESAEAGVG